jgi:hypothetical protein
MPPVMRRFATCATSFQHLAIAFPATVWLNYTPCLDPIRTKFGETTEIHIHLALLRFD